MQIIPKLLESDHWIGRAGHPVSLIVIHITDGDTVDGAIGHWKRPEVEASAHYLVDRDGRIYQAVEEANTAWCNGVVDLPDLTNPVIADLIARGVNPNRVTIGIEIVGRPSPYKPAAQWRSLRELVTDCCRRHGVPQDRTHLVGHYQIDNRNRRRCPSLTDAQWGQLTIPFGFHVLPGMQAALDAHDDIAMGDEEYIHSRLSIVPGRDALYFYSPASDIVYRAPRTRQP